MHAYFLIVISKIYLACFHVTGRQTMEEVIESVSPTGKG